MRKALRRSLLVIMALSFMAFLGTVIPTKNDKTVKAASSSSFYMTDGAYIRPIIESLDGAADQNGIRFVTNVSEAYATDYASEHSLAYDEIEYFTLIGKTANISDVTYANVGNGTVIKKTWTPDFSSGTIYKRNTDLLNYPSTLYETEFTVRSGIRYTNGGTQVGIVYADGTEVTRTMAGVALAAINSGRYTVEDFGKYVGLNKDEDLEIIAFDKLDTIAHYGIDTAEEIDIGVNFTGHTLKIYDEVKPVKSGISVNGNGNLEFSDAYLSDRTYGYIDHHYRIVDLTTNKVYTKTVNICDYEIKDKASFETFRTNVLRSGATTVTDQTVIYAVMTDDVSYNTTGNANSYFRGIFDGQGHTFDGWTTANPAPFWGLNNATIKNVAFTNVSNTRTTTAGGLLYWNSSNAYGANIIENVYVQGVSRATSGVSGICADINTVRYFKNCVFDIEYANDATGGATHYGLTQLEQNTQRISSDVYVVSTTADGFATDTAMERFTNSAFVDSEAAIPSENFDTEYWAVYNGKLTFKSAIKYTDNVITTEEKIVAINRSETGATVSLNDYSINEDNATIVSATFVKVAAINNASLSTDISSYVTLSGANLVFTGISAVPGIGDAEIKIIRDGIRYTVKVPLYVVHYAIGSASELDAFRLGALSTGGTYGALNTATTPDTFVFATLTNNVDASSLTWTSDAYFCGVLDGRGYTISGITTPTSGSNSYAIFWGVNSVVIKNIAFTNVSSNRTNSALLLAYNTTYTIRKSVLENIYVQGTIPNSTNYTAGLVWNFKGAYSSVSNVIVNVEFKDGTSYNGLSGYNGSNNTLAKAENVFVISSNAAAFNPASAVITTNTNTGLYTTTSALVTAIAGGTVSMAAFDSKYWDKTNGYPVWKTVEDNDDIVVDYYINNAEDFKAWAYEVQSYTTDASAPYISAVLTNNITLDGSEFGSGHRQVGYLRGMLDGQGYTVDGLTHAAGGWFANVCSTDGFTMKNIAFTNVSLTAASSNSYFLCSGTNGYIYLENVYIEMTVATTGANAGFNNDGGQLYLTDTIFNFTYTNSTAKVIRANNPRMVENFFAICNNALSYKDGGDTFTTPRDSSSTYTNYGRYENVSALATAIAGGTVSMAAFDSQYWDKTNGYPVWKTVGVDYYISNAEEFTAWAYKVQSYTTDDTAPYISAVLTNNITLDGTEFGSGHRQVGYLRGILDGQGYTVDGLTHAAGAWFANVCKTDGFTMKNIAFTNVNLTAASGNSYFLCSGTSGSIYLENVYIEMTVATSGENAGFNNDGGQLYLTNTIFNFTYTNSTAKVIRSSNPKKVENFFAICKNALSGRDGGDIITTKPSGTTNIYTNYGRFTSYSALKTAITAGTVSMAAFDSKYWDKSAGYPIWKGCVKYVITDGATDYILVAPTTTDQYSALAIYDFTRLFKQATGIDLKVIHDDGMVYNSSAKWIVIGGDGVYTSAGVVAENDTDDGYTIKTVGNSIFVAGKTTRGKLYGAYQLLTELFNYEIVAADTYSIDEDVTDCVLPMFDITADPSFETRLVGWGYGYNTNTYFKGVGDTSQLASRMRMEQNKTDVWIKDENNVYLHNTADIMDFVNHHEGYTAATSGKYGWFWVNNQNAKGTSIDLSSVTKNNDGRVGQVVQVCYSGGDAYNSGDYSHFNEMVEFAAKRMIAIIDADTTGNKYIQFTTEDNPFFCQCDACKSWYNHYNSDCEYYSDYKGVMGTQLRFVNAVANKIVDLRPDLSDYTIVTFCYAQYVDAPVIGNVAIDEDVICPDNVAIYIAPFGIIDYTAPIADDNDFIKVIDGLHVLCADNLMVWLYNLYTTENYNNYNDYFLPYNTFSTYAANYQKLVDEGINFIFHQGAEKTSLKNTAFGTLKAYLNSKLAWDCTLDNSKLINNFFDIYFGDAATTMRTYFNELNTATDTQMAKYGGLSFARYWKGSYDGAFTQDTLITWLGYGETAKSDIAALASTDPDKYAQICKNIDGEMIMVKYLLIRLYRYYDGSAFVEADLNDVKAAFIAECKACDITVGNNQTSIDEVVLDYVS